MDSSSVDEPIRIGFTEEEAIETYIGGFLKREEVKKWEAREERM
ncbi:MAG: hypothetical protein Q7J06_03925 [Bacteroidales bacterium]|nr:hypothetical protein [Bacteroidales bacterium]